MIKKVTPVQVKLKTTIEQDGQQDEYSFEEEGQFVQLGEKYYLRYKEHQDGQETPVQIRLSDDLVNLRRSGLRETNFDFTLERPTKSRYQTEYGMIGMEVTTDKLEIEFDPEEANGKLEVQYRLTANKQLIGTYQLQLQFSA